MFGQLLFGLAPTPAMGGGAVLPSNREIAAIGDSITAQIPGTAVGGYSQRDTRGYAAWAAGLSGDRVQFPATNAKGTGGNTSAAMLARITDVTALSAKTVCIKAGTNDAGGSVSLATYTANIEAMIAACRAVGQVVILMTPPPRDDITGGLTAPQVALLKSYRDYIRSRAAPSQGVYVSDAWNDFSTVADGATCKAGFLRVDGVHPTATGEWWDGYRLSQVFSTLFSAREPWDFDGPSICVNAALAGTSGAKSAGITGSAATSWSANSEALTGDQAVAVSKVTVGGIERQRIAITGTFSGVLGPSFNQTLAGWGTIYNPGDIVSLGVNYEVIQGGANIRNIYANVLYKSGTNVSDPISGAVEQLPPDQLWASLPRLKRFTLPGDATRLTPQFGLALAPGTHNVIVDFWHPHLIKEV